MTKNLTFIADDTVIPAVFLSPDDIIIYSNVNGCKNFCKIFPFDVGTKYHLKIQQYEQYGKTIYAIDVNSNRIFHVQNEDFNVQNWEPREFNNVFVYVSDPWHDAFTSEYGILQNFKYTATATPSATTTMALNNNNMDTQQQRRTTSMIVL